MIVAGIDPSLTSTGIAMANPQGAHFTGQVESVGHDGDSLGQRHDRLWAIADKVILHVMGSDLIVIEGPSLNSKFGHPHDRSGLWWMVVSRLMHSGLTVIEVPPPNRMQYATGKGQAKKDVVLAAAIRRYPDWDITGNDVADSVILCAMGCRYLGQPLEESLPATHLKAMDKVRWPQLDPL